MSNRLKDSLAMAGLSSRIRNIFNLWGYTELLLPAVEPYHQDLRDGAKYADGKDYYLIKPDITCQIAVNLKGTPEIRRVSYVSEVIKKGTTGTWQAGVELIGEDKVKGSVEVLSVAISVIESIGIKDFNIDIGSTDPWMTETSDISSHRETIFNALSRRNFSMIDDLDITSEKRRKLKEMMDFRGKTSGFSKLDQVVSDLSDNRVTIDLGTVKLRSYYDGPVFEMYSPHFERLLGSGGSYSIGDIDAVGFAFDLDALASLYEARRETHRVPVTGGDAKESFRRARELVSMGMAVEVGDI